MSRRRLRRAHRQELLLRGPEARRRGGLLSHRHPARPPSIAATPSRSRSASPTAGNCPATNPVASCASPIACRCSTSNPRLPVTRAAAATAWRNYGISQSQGQLPVGPLARRRPHRQRLGPLHLREQGSHRPVPRNPQGDQTRPPGCGRRLGIYVRHRRPKPTPSASASTSPNTSPTSASPFAKSSTSPSATKSTWWSALWICWKRAGSCN